MASVARFSNRPGQQGRTVIEFSGTAAMVQDAFRTSIHRYVSNGTSHWANYTDPSIPTALAPVAGVNTLHNFPRHSYAHVGGEVTRSKESGRFTSTQPFFTLPLGGCGVQPNNCYAVGPYDFATIYNVAPLWNGTPAIDGTGETIAIVGETDINPQDVASRKAKKYAEVRSGDPLAKNATGSVGAAPLLCAC